MLNADLNLLTVDFYKRLRFYILASVWRKFMKVVTTIHT